jgi:hypothetical protein
MNRRLVTLMAAILAATGMFSSCSALKDPDPFVKDVTITEGVGGSVTIQPLVIEGDTSFGEISVHNETNKKHGFAIFELAVFEEIPAGKSRVVGIAEIKNHTDYKFFCHLHRQKISGQTVDEFSGVLKIEFVAENERR